jgi:hypothetical protein
MGCSAWIGVKQAGNRKKNKTLVKFILPSADEKSNEK